jgi:predicted O-methyltransferase YrrM
MTPFEFCAACATLGVDLAPSPEPQHAQHDAQYRCPSDPDPDRASVTLQEGIVLADWAAGKRVLEVGTGLGVSTVCLADTATEVVTIDPDEWVHANVTLPANVVRVRSLDEVRGTFDLAFIDGDHTYDAVVRDIEECLVHMNADGHVAFHDISHPDVARAVAQFNWSSHEQLDTAGLLTRCGVPR